MDQATSGIVSDTERVLVVGCAQRHLKLFGIQDPVKPQLIKTILLSYMITSLLILDQTKVVCGSVNGNLAIVSLSSCILMQKIKYQHSSHILDMCKVDGPTSFAIAMSKGLSIGNSQNIRIDLNLHLSQQQINCVAYISEQQVLLYHALEKKYQICVILGMAGSDSLIVYDYGKSEVIMKVVNPTGDTNPHRLLQIGPSSFILQDSKGLSYIKPHGQQKVLIENTGGQTGICIDSDKMLLTNDHQGKWTRCIRRIQY